MQNNGLPSQQIVSNGFRPAAVNYHLPYHHLRNILSRNIKDNLENLFLNIINMNMTYERRTCKGKITGLYNSSNNEMEVYWERRTCKEKIIELYNSDRKWEYSFFQISNLTKWIVHLFDNSFIILSGFWMSLLINETFSCFYRFDDHDPQVWASFEQYEYHVINHNLTVTTPRLIKCQHRTWGFITTTRMLYWQTINFLT